MQRTSSSKVREPIRVRQQLETDLKPITESKALISRPPVASFLERNAAIFAKQKE